MSGLIQGGKNKKKQTTRSLVQNKPIEFNSTTNITELKDVKPINESKTTKVNKTNNQQVTLKIPKMVKKDIDTLIGLTDYKYAYEVIDAAIQCYIENKLSPDERKLFKIIQQNT